MNAAGKVVQDWVNLRKAADAALEHWHREGTPEALEAWVTADIAAGGDGE